MTQLTVSSCHLVASCSEGGYYVPWRVSGGVYIAAGATINGNAIIDPDDITTDITADQAFAQMTFTLSANAIYISPPSSAPGSVAGIPLSIPLQQQITQAGQTNWAAALQWQGLTASVACGYAPAGSGVYTWYLRISNATPFAIPFVWSMFVPGANPNGPATQVSTGWSSVVYVAGGGTGYVSARLASPCSSTGPNRIEVELNAPPGAIPAVNTPAGAPPPPAPVPVPTIQPPNPMQGPREQAVTPRPASSTAGRQAVVALATTGGAFASPQPSATSIPTIAGLEGTSAALNAIKTTPNISLGSSNTILAAGLLADGLHGLFGGGGNADGRAPFDQHQFDQISDTADRAVGSVETALEADRESVALLPTRAQTHVPTLDGRIDDSLSQAWLALDTRPSNRAFGRRFSPGEYEKLSTADDAGLDALMSIFDAEVAAHATSAPDRPMTSALATNSAEMTLAADTCRYGSFIASASVDLDKARSSSSAARAAIDHGIAEALHLCGAEAEAGLRPLFFSWSVIFDARAVESARNAGASEAFRRYTDILFRGLDELTQIGLSPKYLRIANAELTLFCDSNSPDMGFLYPDYGRLVSWSDWGSRCNTWSSHRETN